MNMNFYINIYIRATRGRQCSSGIGSALRLFFGNLLELLCYPSSLRTSVNVDVLFDCVRHFAGATLKSAFNLLHSFTLVFSVA
jgi:hypothetical protein